VYKKAGDGEEGTSHSSARVLKRKSRIEGGGGKQKKSGQHPGRGRGKTGEGGKTGVKGSLLSRISL